MHGTSHVALIHEDDCLGPEVAFALRESLERRAGLLLFSGSTGMGKTTFATQLLPRLGREWLDVPRIHDSEGPSVPWKNSFDPWIISQDSRVAGDVSVVWVGDIRHPETAEAACHAAAKRLVLAVMRSGKGPGAVSRLHSMGVSWEALAVAEPIVVNQLLVPRLCRRCAKPVRVDRALFPKRFRSLLDLTSGWVFEPSGCESCARGYAGFALLLEMMSFDREDLARGIVRERVWGNLERDFILKLVQGLVAVEALRHFDLFGDPRVTHGLSDVPEEEWPGSRQAT